MEIEINQHFVNLPESATIAEALASYGAKPPYTVAINGDFVPRSLYAQRVLQNGDRLDIVHPVSGGG